jgi:hypothetical protein
LFVGIHSPEGNGSKRQRREMRETKKKGEEEKGR